MSEIKGWVDLKSALNGVTLIGFRGLGFLLQGGQSCGWVLALRVQGFHLLSSTQGLL